MTEADHVAWHEESPAPRLTQMSLGARRGWHDGEPVYRRSARIVAIGAAPAPRRTLRQVLAGLLPRRPLRGARR